MTISAFRVPALYPIEVWRLKMNRLPVPAMSIRYAAYHVFDPYRVGICFEHLILTNVSDATVVMNADEGEILVICDGFSVELGDA